jgi:prepilin-type N-terminal cleavage/methylation domain-containing protein
MKSIYRARGFTLMEMSVVLVIIAIIIGAVTVGRDVYRSAVAERISSQFVQGWILAYDRYTTQTGSVPGDTTLSGIVGGATTATALCGKDLVDEMLKRGVTLPDGAAEGRQDAYVYQDRNGIPQRIEVCLLAVSDWAEPISSSGYQGRVRNVMRLSNLTPELAQQLDQRLDGRVDARFGRMREVGRQGATSGALVGDAGLWSRHEQSAAGANVDAQIGVVQAYIKMNQ